MIVYIDGQEFLIEKFVDEYGDTQLKMNGRQITKSMRVNGRVGVYTEEDEVVFECGKCQLTSTLRKQGILGKPLWYCPSEHCFFSGSCFKVLIQKGVVQLGKEYIVEIEIGKFVLMNKEELEAYKENFGHVIYITRDDLERFRNVARQGESVQPVHFKCYKVGYPPCIV